MINFDDVANKKIKKFNSYRHQILDRPLKILIIGDSGS